MKDITTILTVVGPAISVLDLLITLFGPLAAVSVAAFVIGVLLGYEIARKRLRAS